MADSGLRAKGIPAGTRAWPRVEGSDDAKPAQTTCLCEKQNKTRKNNSLQKSHNCSRRLKSTAIFYKKIQEIFLTLMMAT
jgi:hypothetical protein